MGSDKKGDPALAETIGSSPNASPALAETVASGTVETVVSQQSPALAATVGDGGGELPSEERVGRYRIKRRLGAGGMGVVYEAIDPELDRAVAIKMLRRGAPAERLRREAQALARLDHRNVVAVYDVGEHDGQVFVAMALVDGTNLREWLAQDRPTPEILRVLLGVARGIVAAHTAGLIHRDLKPDNIFVARDGDVLVGDFGLATEAGDDNPGASVELSAASTGLTLTGHVLGTPAYMAPEQAAGEPSEASDQFSFCVTAYEALYGTRPFVGASFPEILDRVESGHITQPQRARKVPAHIAKAIRRGLSANPEDRFPSMKALVAALDAPTRRRWPYAAGLALVGAGAALVVATREPSDAAACGPTRTQIARTWNPLREAALIAQLRGYEKTAAATLEIVGRLDDYATKWSDVRFAACTDERAHRVSSPQAAARLTCLELGEDSFAETIDAVEQDRREEAIPISKRVAALPPPEACEGTDALKLAIRGGDHRKLMLDLSKADADAGPNGRAPFVALRERAEAAKDSPALLEIGLSEARAALYANEYDAAEDALRRSLLLAEQLDAQTARVRVLALFARVRCAHKKDPESYLAMADAALARLGAEHTGYELDVVLEARAECSSRDPDVAQAITAYEALVRRYEERQGRNSFALAEARGLLATVYRRAGRNADAEKAEAEVARVTELYVGDRTAAATSAAQAALSALMAGDLDQAIQLERRAADLFGGVPGAGKLKAQTLQDLAMYHEVGQHWRVAIDTHTELLATIETIESDGLVEDMRASAFAYRGNDRLYLDDIDTAIPELEKAITLATARKLDEPLAVAQLALGRAWLAKQEPQRALRYLRDGLATHAKLPPGASYRVGLGQFALAQALWQLGEKTEARSAARDAEISVGRGIDEGTANPLGAAGLPARRAKLAEIVTWREAHR